MLTFFPRVFSTRGILCYVVTLVLVSAAFVSHALPFQFMLFGFVPVVLFFDFSNKLTIRWGHYSPLLFRKKLFNTALLIRLGYIIFIYFYYIEMTGLPHAYYAADELQYQSSAVLWQSANFRSFWEELSLCYDFSDRGYIFYLGTVYKFLGPHVLTARVLKCFIDAFSCVLIYNLAKRNFGESTGRIAAVFYMLMPNMWYYCGVTLKETEMAFLVILFVERADAALHSPRITLSNILVPSVAILFMFTFRTALGAVMMAALAGSLILSSGKQLQTWKKVLYTSVFAIWIFLTMGVEIVQETQQLWEARTENQSAGYEWRSQQVGGNTFAKYATASVFAPLIFTIPFSSMVYVEGQENQMMMNGANFIKNIMSGFTIFAIILLLIRKDWRKHVLPLATMCGYLVVLVFSNFAHSERFHFPVLALELVFAAYGVSQVTNKHKRWFTMWLIAMCIANIAWAWIKLAGRGLA